MENPEVPEERVLGYYAITEVDGLEIGVMKMFPKSRVFVELNDEIMDRMMQE